MGTAPEVPNPTPSMRGSAIRLALADTRLTLGVAGYIGGGVPGDITLDAAGYGWPALVKGRSDS